MLAKKESFLKYLRDEDPPNKNSKDNNNSRINKEDNNNIINHDNNMHLIKDNKNKDKDDDFSFDNFINHVKDFDYNKKVKWDSEIHKTSIINDKNMYKIKLMELFRINYTNPLLIINKDYLKSTYQPYLFEQEINHIEDEIKINQDNNNIKNKNNNININNSSILENPNLFVEHLIEEREKYELNQKILKYYLIYYSENNYVKIAPSLNKIEQITNDVNFYYDKIHKGKNKMKDLKKINIDNTMKLILKKKKQENLLKIYLFLKNNILTCYKDIKKLKLKWMNYDYLKYYEENNKIINNIELIDKKIQLMLGEKNINQNKKIILIDEIKKKLMKKKEKFTCKYITEVNNLFDSKKK